MASKDIEKLREKFDKDPNSKLFLPLAEEYRKEGMLDEAIEVLHSGLEKHTTYTSARVLLGKIYHEKGMLDEARKEFEGVIKIVPDNLFAHKKLAEIYRDTGETELAVRSCKSILKLNPMDEETVNSLKEIEAAIFSAQAVGSQPDETAADAIRISEPAYNELPADMHIGEEIRIEAPDIQVEHSDDELNAFKDSLFGNNAGIGDEMEAAPEALSFHQDEKEESVSVSAAEEDAVSVSDGLSFADLGEEIRAEEGLAFEEPASVAPDEEEAIELVDESFDLAGDIGISFEEPLPVQVNNAADISEADRYVSEGRFSDAMTAYKAALSSDPNNKRVLQRVEELRALLKLMGKDKEVLVAKLNSFLEGINKRRDEFLGRS